MKERLNNIAEISSGHNFPRKVDHDPLGNCRFIQLKDIDVNCIRDVENLMKVSIKYLNGNAFIRENDILFKSKSNNNIACVMPEQYSSVVASAHFFIIRANENIVLPEYLAWYINQKLAQKYFKLHSAGSTVSVVTKKILGELNVKILPIVEQRKVVKLANLRKKQQELEANIKNLYDKIYEQKILTIIK